ncbi:MAG: 50S ribosomal protein L25 [Patescibacteria group bacterium]
MSLILNIEKRDLTKAFPKPDKVESLTKLLRGVFYGQEEESTPIIMSYADFKKVWKEAGGSSIITLKGVGEEKEVIIQAIDFDPITDAPRHVDFYVIKRGTKMEVEVPLVFVGIAPAVKELGGALVKVMHELRIEVLPKDLPKQIEVDISALKNFESKILAKDLKLPESAELAVDAEETVALVIPVTEEEVEVVTPDIADIKIEKKGKKDESETSAEEKTSGKK